MIAIRTLLWFVVILNNHHVGIKTEDPRHPPYGFDPEEPCFFLGQGMNGGLVVFHGILWWFNGNQMGFHRIYPLVNSHNYGQTPFFKLEKSP